MQQRIQECKTKHKKYNRLFRNTFGIPLSKFYDNIFGLDIVGLDTFIGTPDNTSMEDFINSEYGVGATAMIKDLL